MNTFSMHDALADWEQGDLHNLLALLECKSSLKVITINDVEDVIKPLYHSQTRAMAKSSLNNATSWVTSKFTSNETKYTSSSDMTDYMPSYYEFLLEACEHLDCRGDSNDVSIEELELYLSHSVIVSALTKMNPTQRIEFFSTQLSVEDITENVTKTDIRAPMTAIAALGVANASGFGVYMASTTALGFMTHAVGVTLPFAVYSGLTSTIAVVIGPLGWLAAGSWGVWKITGPEWKKIIPALIYIISVNSHNKLVQPSLSPETPDDE